MTGPANRPSSSSVHTNTKQTNKNKPNSKNNVNRIQSVSNKSNSSNDVFTDDEILNSDFKLVKNNSKRNLSSTSLTEKSEIKKPKHVFVSTNRFNSLPHDIENFSEIDDTQNNNSNNTDIPRCVRCADFYPTSQCTQSKDVTPTCALCRGDHTENYRGCSVHKNLQHSNFKSNSTSKNLVNNNTIVNKQVLRPSDRTHPPTLHQ